MQISRRTIGAFIAAALFVVGLAPGAFAASEDSLLSRINDERESRGLATLASHWDLADDAEAHSAVMMATDNLHHNPNLGSVTTGWVSLGENVGVGPSVSSIHTAFMNSPPHRGNVLGDFTHVGIGAVRASENKLWITVVFMKSAAAPTATTTTTSAPSPPASVPTMAPPEVTSPPAPASPPTVASPPEAPAEALAAAPLEERVGSLATARRVRLRHMPRPL